MPDCIACVCMQCMQLHGYCMDTAWILHEYCVSKRQLLYMPQLQTLCSDVLVPKFTILKSGLVGEPRVNDRSVMYSTACVATLFI